MTKRHGISPVLPTSALLWLLIAFGLLLLPQLDRLPIWLSVSCVALAGWRWLVQLGIIRLPGRILRIAIMVALIAFYVLGARGQFSVETASSFFVLAVGMKWLETRTTRDVYVLFFILCYLAAVNFLFQQGILWALINFIGISLLLISLQVLNAPDIPNSVATSWRRLGGLLLKTLPVVVLLFIFFPRLSPLWSVPLVSGQARTGISDSMEPGSISDLAQSSERAFRVTFGGMLPEYRDRYWRGLILDRFENERWEQADKAMAGRPGRISSDGGIGDLREDEYDVLLEPTYQRWAFALDNSSPVSANVTGEPDGTFVFDRPADTSIRYRMEREENPSQRSNEQTLSQADQYRYLQLPREGNPRARDYARKLLTEYQEPLDYAQALMARFRSQPYFYTLRPPAMPEDSVDALLFDVKRGFCAHYASATAFMLRAAGIPSRIVIGYQGGSPGNNDEYLIIRQYDAHAWVELWSPDRGWVRLDPTAAIAPQRIESGLRDAVAEEGSFLENEWISPSRYGDVALVRWLTLQADSINYEWQRWVVGYQGQTQMNLMSRLPGNFSLRDLGYLSAGLFGGSLLVAGLWTSWRQRRRVPNDPLERLMVRWRRLLEARGVDVTSSDTPITLARKAADQMPAQGSRHAVFARAVNNHYYGSAPLSRRDWLRLKRLLSSLTR
ncbi:transglutaminase family protein [Marinobacter sp. V034]|uniref:transglutaminase family protein n=1 Tax=Marinobacter sp. V034 TaxID=3459610 RepID=UPI0040450C92